MGWLKAILNENRKVVAGWPAWKRGEQAVPSSPELQRTITERDQEVERLTASLRVWQVQADQLQVINADRCKDLETLRARVRDLEQLIHLCTGPSAPLATEVVRLRTQLMAVGQDRDRTLAEIRNGLEDILGLSTKDAPTWRTPACLNIHIKAGIRRILTQMKRG